MTVLFWLVAAVLVGGVHAQVDPWSARAGAVLAVLVLLATAFAYTRFCARYAGGTHALAVGIAWLVLSIAVEIAVTMHLGHGWFTLLGPPDHPLLRQMMLFAWIFAPVLFAARRPEGR